MGKFPLSPLRTKKPNKSICDIPQLSLGSTKVVNEPNHVKNGTKFERVRSKIDQNNTMGDRLVTLDDTPEKKGLDPLN